MKKLQYLLGLFIFVSVFSTGCLNDKNKIPANCFDGILNNDEEKIDCGGPCIACDPCENGLWDYELGEVWVDCGGDCGECPPHANGCQDEGESGIDCGGTSGISCSSLCNDGLPNGWETAAIDPETNQPFVCDPNLNPINYLGDYFIDCGGDCEPCEVCDDGILNQDEQWIDCGGICGDCGVTPAPLGSCINGFQDGAEIDEDCSGVNPATNVLTGSCPPCEVQLECTINGVFHDFTALITVQDYILWDDALMPPVNRKSIQFAGVSDDGWAIEGQIAEPTPAGWSLSSSIFCNSANGGGDSGTYLTVSSIEIAAGSSSSQNVDPFFNPGEGITYTDFTKLNMGTPGYIIGSFSGETKTGVPPQVPYNVTNGKFKLITPW